MSTRTDSVTARRRDAERVSEEGERSTMTTSRTTLPGTQRRRPLVRWCGWRPALWMVASVSVALDWAVTYVVSFLLLVTNAGVCSEPSTAGHLRVAQRGFVILLATLAVPWLIAGIRSRFRRRVALFGVAGLAPALVWTVQTLMNTPAGFTMTWCLF